MMYEKLFARRMEFVKPSAIRELLKLGAEPDVISFGGGYPDPLLFPVEKMEQVFKDVLAKDSARALQYTTSEGLPSLRQKLASRMKNAGVECTTDNVFITHGGQQGMDLVAKMLIDKGDVIVTENPTFLGALIAFNPYEPQYRPIRMDENGMVMDELEQVLKTTPNVKFIYTIPDFQNPTGVTLSLERRKRMIELANKYDVLILEDTPYREIRYEGDSLPTIKSFDTEDRVIYLGSFSKILCPGMRLGWVVAEAKTAEKLCLLKMAADTQCSTLNMFLADRFMEMFDIDAHIQILRDAYRKKKNLMLEVIGKAFPGNVSWTNPQGGLFTWLTVAKDIDTAKLMKERTLPEARVAYVPGAGFFPNRPENNHCRVNYSCMTEDKIVEGMTKLGGILKGLAK